MKAAIECCGPAESFSGPAINAVFYVPGSLACPDWEGIRDARFSRKRQLQMVKVAIPPELVNSSDLKDYVLQSLHRANAVGYDFFRKKGLVFPIADANAVVDRIKERLDANNDIGGIVLR